MANKFLDNNGLTYFWQKIKEKLNNKVDKVEGKALSTNDYTTAEKNKLSGIAEGANKTVVDSTLSTTSTNPVQNKVINTALSGKADTTHTHKIADVTNLQTTLDGKASTNPATQSANGLMSKEDKTKLDGISADATEIRLSDMEDNLRNMATDLGNKVDAVDGKGLSTNDYTTADKTKLDNITIDVDKKIQHFININTTYNGDYTSGTFIMNNPSENYKYFANDNDYETQAIVLRDSDLEYNAYCSNLENLEWVAVKKDRIITVSVVTLETTEISGTIEITYLPEFATLAQLQIQQNVEVATSMFSEDITYADLNYNYKGTIPISGITTRDIVNITFNMAQAASGNFAPISSTYNGGVYIYAKEIPTSTINVNLEIIKGVTN